MHVTLCTHTTHTLCTHFLNLKALLESNCTLTGNNADFQSFWWRLGCGLVSETDKGVCLAWSEQRDGSGGGEPRQGVLLALHTYKNGRLRAWPRLFPTRSTFFSTGMRPEHLLQAQTYNLGLSGPLSGRIQRHWAFPRSPPPTGRGIPAHAFLSTHPRPRRRIVCRGSGVG